MKTKVDQIDDFLDLHKKEMFVVVHFLFFKAAKAVFKSMNFKFK